MKYLMANNSKQHLAIVAPIGAGKTTVAKYFVSKGFELYKLSYALYEEVDKRGMDKNDRTTLQDVGDDMRASMGSDALAQVALKQIRESPKSRFVIESIRNHHELSLLRKELGDKLLILAIDAPLEIRYDRVVKRQGQYNEQETTFEEFKKVNDRDLGIGNKSNEQNVAKCLKMADVNILNDGDEKDLENITIKLFDKYFGEY